MRKHLILGFCTLLLFPTAWAQSTGAQSPGGRQQGPAGGRGAHMAGWGQGGGWGMMGGAGAGMMGGAGFGMMGQGWNTLNLTKEQRNKLYAIHKDLRDKQFALMDKMHENMQSVNLYRAGKFDEQAARSMYDASEKLHRQMFENMLDAQKRADSLLTPEQRQQLSQANQ
jgi:Spy/CpxP family protein refolding chaperone